jgi:hypothetical protein
MLTVSLARMVAVRLFSKVTEMYTDLVDSMSLIHIAPSVKSSEVLIFHRGVFTDPSLGPILYYHYVDTTIGYADSQKLFGWNKIDFSSGWPVV